MKKIILVIGLVALSSLRASESSADGYKEMKKMAADYGPTLFLKFTEQEKNKLRKEWQAAYVQCMSVSIYKTLETSFGKGNVFTHKKVEHFKNLVNSNQKNKVCETIASLNTFKDFVIERLQ